MPVISARLLTLLAGLAVLYSCGRADKSKPKAEAPVASVESNRAPQDLRFVHLYENPEYGFAVNLPENLVATCPGPPLPQHGFRIALPSGASDFIWTDASYNAAEYESAQVAAAASFAGSPRPSSPLRFLPDRIAGFEAARARLRYIDSISKKPIVEEVAAAIRPNRSIDDGIIYTIGLRTQSQSYGTNVQAFDKVLRGFVSRPLPH